MAGIHVDGIPDIRHLRFGSGLHGSWDGEETVVIEFEPRGDRGGDVDDVASIYFRAQNQVPDPPDRKRDVILYVDENHDFWAIDYYGRRIKISQPDPAEAVADVNPNTVTLYEMGLAFNDLLASLRDAGFLKKDVS